MNPNLANEESLNICIESSKGSGIGSTKYFQKGVVNIKKVGEAQFKKQLETTAPLLLCEAEQILPNHQTEDQQFVLWQFSFVWRS